MNNSQRKILLKRSKSLWLCVLVSLVFCILFFGCTVNEQSASKFQCQFSLSSLNAVEGVVMQVASLPGASQDFNNEKKIANVQSLEDKEAKPAQIQKTETSKTQISNSDSTTDKLTSSNSTTGNLTSSEEANIHKHSWVSKERVIAPAQSISKKCAKGDVHHTMWVVKSEKDGSIEHLYYLQSDARAYANQLRAEGYSPTCNSWYRPHYISGTKSEVKETYEVCSCGAERNHVRSGGIETWIDDGSPCEAWWGKK